MNITTKQIFGKGVNEHQNVDLPEAWQLLQGQTKWYVQVSSGLVNEIRP